MKRSMEIYKLLAEKIRALRDVMDERHERYKERAEADAQKTALALTASKEAVGKAEEAQRAYNSSHNDRMPRQEAERALKEQADRLDEMKTYQAELRLSIPRDIGILRSELMKEIGDMRNAQTSSGARLSQKEKSEASSSASSRWILGLVVLSMLSLLTSTIAVLAIFSRK